MHPGTGGCFHRCPAKSEWRAALEILYDGAAPPEEHRPGPAPLRERMTLPLQGYLTHEKLFRKGYLAHKKQPPP